MTNLETKISRGIVRWWDVRAQVWRETPASSLVNMASAMETLSQKERDRIEAAAKKYPEEDR